MTATVALIDYGAGNLTSVMRGLRRAGIDPVVATSPASLADAAGIVVPGVGHFSATAIISDAWREALLARVTAGVPLLGICLGMQWLFEGSTEAPGIPGLALAQGSCQSLNKAGSYFELTPGFVSVKIPHLGWNRVEQPRDGVQVINIGSQFAELTPDVDSRDSRLLAGVESGAFAYFAHSFAAPVGPETVATTTHGATFASVIERDNVFGTQFHPELSSETGAAIFANFARVVGR